jgi:disulfide bond formation protein DsbB
MTDKNAPYAAGDAVAIGDNVANGDFIANGDYVTTWAPIAAMTVAWVAMLGSLYYSEIRSFVPCPLCWYQRILMYPLALITLIGVIRDDGNLPAYVLPFSFLGIAVSGYHYLIQLGVFGQSNVCAIGIPCSLRYVNIAGFITIPFQALLAFILITIFMLLAWKTTGRTSRVR